MKSRRTKAFRKLFDALSAETQRLAMKAYQQFKQNSSHPGLHFKSIDPADPTVYSVRIGHLYRAIGIVRGDTVYWVWIGPHSEYDQRIK